MKIGIIIIISTVIWILLCSIIILWLVSSGIRFKRYESEKMKKKEKSNLKLIPEKEISYIEELAKLRDEDILIEH